MLPYFLEENIFLGFNSKVFGCRFSEPLDWRVFCLQKCKNVYKFIKVWIIWVWNKISNTKGKSYSLINLHFQNMFGINHQIGKTEFSVKSCIRCRSKATRHNNNALYFQQHISSKKIMWNSFWIYISCMWNCPE